MNSNGIHHVTAIAGAAQLNLDFYTRTLGLRLVKRTVNFDDPGTWHLYFGNEAAAPGTIMTFFPWEQMPLGQAGAGEVGETAFVVPAPAIDFWAGRLVERGVVRGEAFGQGVLRFTDPDGLRLVLVGVAGAETLPGWAAEVPEAVAIRGFFGASLTLRETAPVAAVLGDVFGFVEEAREGRTTRMRVPGVVLGGVVDLVQEDSAARMGRGSVHHVAFRAADDAAQAAMVSTLAARHGLRTTEQKDRDYFRSVYFRAPGGVLFEIATDGPGFAVDEAPEELGSALRLPAFLQSRREAIVAALPVLER